ncbi:GNAT family N-acetyltransferase [Citromicrobium bathyomarinum]|jgi:RimJ/RimL family protein N-acetyltransferase|uniref:GNAT family N-acetyltransferase n=1 Tax=Sphingomonadales TaxID=204457 RepID=UPI000C526EEC|nr:GNAT family N-acetyltransferase [Citromicrobium sp.]MBO79911.1 GNAT family N-acetyltransferase [Citromicrobium sp.]|tara:strand:+ start:1890 stop:2438 length:549 start_codon:yes stop_codon:yes gene_type:complete
MLEIRTDRLVLRPARPGDLRAFHAILSDRDATAFWSTPAHTDITETQAWLDAMLAIEPAQGEDFVIELDGRVIGKVGMYAFPEIGFILHPDAWGRGFAGEALRPVLDRAFAVHDLPTVEADVDPRNTASLRLLRRMGFEETGRESRTLKIGDEWCDSVYLSLKNPKADGARREGASAGSIAP